MSVQNRWKNELTYKMICVIEISFYKKVDVKICTLSCIFRTVYFYSTVIIQSSFIIQYLHNSDKKCLVFLNCFNTKYVLFDITVFGMYFTNGHNYFDVQWLSTKSVHFFFYYIAQLNMCLFFAGLAWVGFFFQRDSFLPITFVEVLYIKIWLARPQFTAFPSSMQHSNGHIESNLYRWL